MYVHVHVVHTCMYMYRVDYNYIDQQLQGEPLHKPQHRAVIVVS